MAFIPRHFILTMWLSLSLEVNSNTITLSLAGNLPCTMRYTMSLTERRASYAKHCIPVLLFSTVAGISRYRSWTLTPWSHYFTKCVAHAFSVVFCTVIQRSYDPASISSCGSAVEGGWVWEVGMLGPGGNINACKAAQEIKGQHVFKNIAAIEMAL